MHAQTAVKFYKDDYIIFSRDDDLQRLCRLPVFNVISIDPACKNFAIRCEVRTKTCVTTIRLMKEKFDDSIQLYKQITEFLNRFDFTSCDICLIERQMSVNYTMIRASQHCITYFCIKYPHMIVVEESPKLKTRILNAPPKLNYNERKKWSIQEAERLFDMYGDSEGKRLFKSIKGKKDDAADTVTQAEAFFILIGYTEGK